MAARVPSDSLRSERTPSLVSQDTVAEKRDYNPEVWHLKFRSFSPSERSNPIQDLKRISELCSFWLRPDLHSKEEILDQLVLEQFMISARPELQALVKESGVKSCKELERLLRNGEKPRQWSIIHSRGQVYLLRHPCAENAAATKIEWDDVNLSPEHLSRHEEPPNRGQARPELQNLLETEEPSTSQSVTSQRKMSFLRGSGLEMAKAKAGDWGDDLVVLSDDSLSSDQASPGSQNLPRTKPCTSQEEKVFLETVPGSREPEYLRPERNQGSDLVQDWDVLFIPQGPQPTQGPGLQRICSASADSLSTSHRKASCMGNTEDGQLAVATLQSEESVVHLVGRAWFGCSQCNKSFLYRSQFIIHQRTHTGERPSQCRLCQKEFVQSSDLGVHQCIHTGEKPYWCSICSKVFTCESFLLGHIRTHTKEMPYLCEHCGKRLNHKGNLDIHVGIHGDSRPYRCMECNEAFQQKGTLMRHVKIHSREVPL